MTSKSSLVFYLAAISLVVGGYFSNHLLLTQMNYADKLIHNKSQLIAGIDHDTEDIPNATGNNGEPVRSKTLRELPT